ncbi:prepilin-type N-terminal cleavage/methylation domain-containing protein [Desulfatitalea alkaliphila]|uniref:Prepilin-type N-terminal cleavage/methylation domain-containing protein n=1 Tax=Desulfatitalea alkaliphila TaxID=2929485 RepID=A0AA41R5F5_9BACT|nr:prepilin-type N-terminal cleavage/methylation domain-containing protein [Desulfatitalea alkaliphila]MCJ8502147.1 prepilin-type N-terminal cleavage/methylation domain-containing protein [Desulfatitalea alkaliphila]
MMQDMRRMLGQNKGFTLVEMALVLIIIGIIIGAVVKGKDLVRGAEQKKIYSKFLNEWRLVYLNFYDRTGRILGDTQDASVDPATDGQDGQADTNAGRDALVDSGAATAYRGLRQVGLTPPVSNVPDTPYEYRYVNSEGNTNRLTIQFLYEDGDPSYNYMEIEELPTELAIALDTMIDGEADGTDGDFINADGTNDWDTSGDTPATNTNTARWKMQF